MTLVGALILANLGWFTSMHQNDRTRLTYVILLIFIAATVWAGKLAWRVSGLYDRLGLYDSDKGKRKEALKAARADPNVQFELRELDEDTHHGTLAEKLCPLLGLLGTVIGLLLMFNERFGQMIEGDAQQAKEGLGQMAAGLSTALITTEVGIACALILILQYHFIASAIGKPQERKEVQDE